MPFSLVQEWVPSEDEIPADHWSKSPEYLAEKAARIASGDSSIVVRANAPNTHETIQQHFKVEYRAEESEASEAPTPAVHWSEAEKGKTVLYESSADKADRMLAESNEFRNGLRPDPLKQGSQLWQEQDRLNREKAQRELVAAVTNLSRWMKIENILYLVREALQQ
jgi:5'-deoxynucleotidase YfbR-like HD superfamily hydrolase